MSFGFGVGDFLAVLKLASDVRKNVVNAPAEFKVLDVEIRTLTNTIQDTEVHLDSCSPKQRHNLGLLLSECCQVLKELQDYTGKFLELEPPPSPPEGGKPRRKHLARRLWRGLQWDSGVVNTFQIRITSIITKMTALRQGKLNQSVNVLVDHDAQQRRWELFQWISPDDYAATQRDILSNRVDPSASKWLLDTEEFRTWSRGSRQTLFCPGIPGAGKTMTTAVLVEHLQSDQSSFGLTGYVYCSYQSQKQSASQLLASVLRSLVQQSPTTPRVVQELFNKAYKLDKGQMTDQQIRSAITDIARSGNRANVVVDALDELERDDRYSLIEQLLHIQEESGLNLFFTSRFNAEIEDQLGQHLTREIRATEEDVKGYLRANLTRLPRFVASNDDLRILIVEGIAGVADGMFLLAQLHLNSLKHKTSPKEIRDALSELSSGSAAYDKAYADALDRINSQVQEPRMLALKTLTILVTARRALSPDELCHALAVDLKTEEVDDDEDVREVEDVLATCAGLVTVDIESNVVRLVHKSTQDYFQRNRTKIFPDAEHLMGHICSFYRTCKVDDRGNAPFYQYADGNWWSHLSEATRQQEVAAGDNASLDESESVKGLGPSKLAEELRVQLGITLFCKNPTLYLTMRNACGRGDQSLLEALIDVTMLDVAKEGNELLLTAVENGHLDIVKLLLRRGASPNCLLPDHGRPVLFRAIELDEPKIVECLLDSGADPKPKSGTDGETAFLWATRFGSLSCIELLKSRKLQKAVEL